MATAAAPNTVAEEFFPPRSAPTQAQIDAVSLAPSPSFYSSAGVKLTIRNRI